MQRWAEFLSFPCFFITSHVYLKILQKEGRFETLILAEEGIALKIPVGAEYIESPGTFASDNYGTGMSIAVELLLFPGGKFYSVKWTKDREGRLRIYDYSPDCIEDGA